MAKYSKESYQDAIFVLFPNLKELEIVEINKLFNVPDIVKLSADLYFSKDLDALSYKERLAFEVMKSIHRDLKKQGYFTFGDRTEGDLK